MIVKIQHRRGSYNDYDPSKVLPGELVVTQSDDPNSSDGEAVYIGTKAGKVKQLATSNELDSKIATALQSAIPEFVDEVTQEAQDAADRAEAAAEHLVTDTTLTVAGRAADAKKTGDEIAQLKNDITHIGLSENVKSALLDCFRNVAWINDQGQTYYDVLEDALYEDMYPRITAIYNPGVNVVYTDDTLDTLKQYLTVKYYATKESTGTVVASNDYILSGLLTEGTSVVEITYEDLHTRVNIPGVVDFYNIWEWTYQSSSMIGRIGNLTTDSDETRYGIATNSNVKYRFIVGTNRGVAPIFDIGNNVYTNVYPIPIPSGASKITMEYENASFWGGANIWQWNNSKYTRTEDLGSFGYEGGGTREFTNNQNSFATLVFGQPNNGSFETKTLSFCNIRFE